MTALRLYCDTPDGNCITVQPRQVRHQPTPSHNGMWTRYADTWAPVRIVRYRPSVSPHVCDTACQTATGHLCECACAGRNHGRFRGITKQRKAAPQMELSL